MKKIAKSTLVLVIFLVLILMISACQRNDAKTPDNSDMTLEENVDYVRIDKPSVDFELEDLDGNTIKLSDYKGQLVFLNFWGTWCPPCRKEMPHFESIHKQFGDKGTKILAVSSTQVELQGGNDSDRAKNQVQSFIDDGGFTFPIPLDSGNEVFEEYNKIFPVIGIPITYMIDKEGIIRYVLPGAFRDEDHIKAFMALLDQE
ncbi:MAG TPA: redoxin domain-containing protein [Clostridia bacterium]|nr:redoxin domain-containing protein [Clostridia bacterium]